MSADQKTAGELYPSLNDPRVALRITNEVNALLQQLGLLPTQIQQAIDRRVSILEAQPPIIRERYATDNIGQQEILRGQGGVVKIIESLIGVSEGTTAEFRFEIKRGAKTIRISSTGSASKSTTGEQPRLYEGDILYLNITTAEAGQFISVMTDGRVERA